MSSISKSNMTRLNTLADEEMLDSVQLFHQKTKYLIDERIPNCGKFPIPKTELMALEYTDNEISPFFHQSIKLSAEHPVSIKRKRSHAFFAKQSMSFSLLSSVLCESFSANKEGKRPYPSGGALYPVEPIAILMEERITDGPASGVYHFRPSLEVLQPLRCVTTQEMYDSIFIEDTEQLGWPCFALVYVVNLMKATVKYGYRGYRNALLEAGSMYQQADLVAGELGLRTRLSSSFSDDQLRRFLELDGAVHAPMVIQYFGF